MTEGWHCLTSRATREWESLVRSTSSPYHCEGRPQLCKGGKPE